MFEGRRVLVTGADGFIGSHLAEMLVREGATVRALSQYNSFNNWGWLEDVSVLDDIEVVTGDVRDAAYCNTICKKQDIIFNLAALIAIPYSYVAPESYVDTNVKGALNVCKAAVSNDVEKVVQISTSEVYGTAQYVPIDEKHPVQPQSPYSASKIGADAIAMSFHNAFGLGVTIARPFNTYGPRQSARAVIPTVITQIAAGMKEIKIGDGTPTRDFNYVEDTCLGLCMLGHSDKVNGQTVNIGSNYEISVFDTVNKIRGIMGSQAVIVTDELRLRPTGSEVFRLWCDNRKIRELVGFAPRYSLDEGLSKTVEWFMDHDNLKKYKAGIYNV
ncbi:NAD-dependent 4,6-dehydratase LegB [Alicyclobacillus mengziensis]|uniref:SDR family NAD(P)-dependent oxidoreductase n=1 Tax=Alicyclobacillus mengziensis TaxID=2931921 RepID=A0A9X7W2N4_9BACL|nr:NAD-dependent 4,6-dehydratase LegB [Alicyclobacillus mengziensis]QSO49586.1 SDR family NAD(P)-dependent oxidoreductase [Alicyclobacillus mengziensis]